MDSIMKALEARGQALTLPLIAAGIILALHEFLWDSYLKLSLIFNWNAPSDPRCEDFFAGIVLAAIERASLG